MAKMPALRMGIFKRSDDMSGFVVLPRRWVVERTFSSFGRNRRLAKNFENLAETLATFRNHRLNPACRKAAGQGLAREVKMPVVACHGESANGGTRSLVT